MAGPRSKTSALTLQKLRRQEKALDLRRSGLSFERIGAKIGISTSRAHSLVMAGLADARAQITGAADELRAEEVARLDAMLHALWTRAKKGEAAAIDRVLKIGERRQKLLGLEAPVRIETTGRDGKPIEVSSSVSIDPSKLSTQALRELLDARTKPLGS